MALFREGIAIFSRNPVASTCIILLILAASLGQVVSLGSLYPVVQSLVVEEPSDGYKVSGIFVSALNAVGITPSLANLLSLFVFLAIGYSILNWVAEAVQGAYLCNFEIQIRRELLESAVGANWTYSRGLRHGEFINVVTREAGQYKYVVKFALYAFGCFLQFAALFGYAIYVNWRVTAFGIVMFAIGSLVLIPLLKATNRLGRQSTDLANNMSNHMVAALRSLKTVKALSLEKFLVKTLQPSFERSSSNYFRQNLLASGQWAITETIAFVTMASMLFLGLQILRISKAELFIILVLLFRALPQLRNTIDNYHRAYGYLSSMEIVRQHIARASSASTPQYGLPVSEDWKQIEFERASFTYEDGAPIVNEVSFTIHRSEFWAVLGSSGSGKTTLLDILLGLLQPQTGTVKVDGVALTDTDLVSWHGQVSYLGQEAYVFAGTLRENLVWGTERRFRDAELLSALRSVRLEGIATHETHVLDIDVGENGCNLSGGEKQRLALARLFLRHAPLMILDEPTTGLDTATEREIFNSISACFQDTTVIMVTHREELTHNADRIIRFTPEGIKIERGRGISRGAVVL